MGRGPVSAPPAAAGSSTTSRVPPSSSTSWAKPSRRRATTLMLDPLPRPANRAGSSTSAKRAIAKARSEARLTKRITVSPASSPASFRVGDPALGAADDGPGDVELGGELVAAGDDELRRQLDLGHVAVDPLLQRGDHLLGDAADPVLEPPGGLRRGRQLGPGDEEVVLEAEDVGGELGLLGAAERAGDAEASRPRRGCRRPRCGRGASAPGRRTRARSSRRRPSWCRS